MTKRQTLRKFWHWELFWRDLHSIWHLFIFLGRTSKKQHPVSQKHPKKVLSGAWLRIAFSVNPMTPRHSFPIIIKQYIINSGDYDFQRVRAVEMKKRSLLRNRLALAVLSKCSFAPYWCSVFWFSTAFCLTTLPFTCWALLYLTCSIFFFANNPPPRQRNFALHFPLIHLNYWWRERWCSSLFRTS